MLSCIGQLLPCCNHDLCGHPHHALCIWKDVRGSYCQLVVNGLLSQSQEQRSYTKRGTEIIRVQADTAKADGLYKGMAPLP